MWIRIGAWAAGSLSIAVLVFGLVCDTSAPDALVEISELETIQARLFQILTTGAIILAFLVFEFFLKAEGDQPRNNVVFNLKCGLFYLLLGGSLAALAAKAVRALTFYGELKLLRLVTDGESPWILIILGALLWVLVFDFFYYWFHRLQHSWSLLWRQHKLHHSDPSLNVTTTLRHHWLEEALRVPLITVPMAVFIEMDLLSVWVVATTVYTWGFFIHANLRLPLGPLTPFFGGPQVHRIHHSNRPQHADKNFAAFFPFLDIIFGTYYKPACGRVPHDRPAFGRSAEKPVRGSPNALRGEERKAAALLKRDLEVLYSHRE
jgi:sterol desaturase/sphingolipid hydroxylase (fatty acid hydroxylase superfamily)